MVIIHVVEDVSVLSTRTVPPHGFLENLVQFGAGPLAAPAFMFCMGVGIVYSRNSDERTLAQRGVTLIVLGYALSLVRDVIPDIVFPLLRGMPVPWDSVYYDAFVVDILFFAGMSHLTCALLTRFRVPYPAYVLIAIVMQIAGNLLGLLPIGGTILEFFLAPLFRSCPLSGFPLLTCFTHVAVGVSFGYFLIRHDDVDRLYRNLFLCALVLMAGLLYTLISLGYDLRNFYMLANDTFYKQDFLHFVFNTLVIALELSLFHFMLQHVRPAESLVHFCGRNLNSIYIIQWIIVGHLNELRDCFTLGIGGSILLGFAIAFVSIGIVKILPPFDLTRIGVGRGTKAA